MKRIAPAAALALAFSMPVWSQAQQDKPSAPMKVEAKAEPQAAKPAPARRSRANEDARACLKFPTNLEIHKCAEQYR